MRAKWLQSCPTLCNPMDCRLGSSVHGILQARILEWVAIPFSRGFSWPWDRIHVSCGSWIAIGFFIAEPPGKPITQHTQTYNKCHSILFSHKMIQLWTKLDRKPWRTDLLGIFLEAALLWRAVVDLEISCSRIVPVFWSSPSQPTHCPPAAELSPSQLQSAHAVSLSHLTSFAASMTVCPARCGLLDGMNTVSLIPTSSASTPCYKAGHIISVQQMFTWIFNFLF